MMILYIRIIFLNQKKLFIPLKLIKYIYCSTLLNNARFAIGSGDKSRKYIIKLF